MELISIITPCYNNARFLPFCVQSVLGQLHTNWEMLIVDDCSTDNSFEIAQRFASQDARIKVFKLQINSGSGVARNKAILESKGDLIAFLDSDDIWHPEKLSMQLKYMKQYSAAFSHTSYGYLYEDGRVMKKRFIVSDKCVDYKSLLKRTEISCLTAMYDVRIVGKVYMPDLRRKQDFALWLEILARGYDSLPVKNVLAWYRQVNGSATSSKYKLVLKHYTFLRRTQNLSIMKSIHYTCYWLVNGVVRYYLK